MLQGKSPRYDLNLSFCSHLNCSIQPFVDYIRLFLWIIKQQQELASTVYAIEPCKSWNLWLWTRHIPITTSGITKWTPKRLRKYYQTLTSSVILPNFDLFHKSVSWHCLLFFSSFLCIQFSVKSLYLMEIRYTIFVRNGDNIYMYKIFWKSLILIFFFFKFSYWC